MKMEDVSGIILKLIQKQTGPIIAEDWKWLTNLNSSLIFTDDLTSTLIGKRKVFLFYIYLLIYF